VADDQGLEITRTFDAPREHIWREWTDPERFADWYGGPEFEVPIDSVSMDVRVGGKLSLVMIVGPREVQWDGEYIEVTEPERLVFTIRDDPSRDSYERCTVELKELDGDRTEMHFTQTGSMPAEMYKRAKEGWGGMFDYLAARLGER
jgi:uncharacterized protein YndB with AHSA1/START domain